MTYAVEITHPYMPDDRLDERHECTSPAEAGEWAESLAPLDGDEVAELLAAGEKVTWDEDEGYGRVLTAERVGAEVPA